MCDIASALYLERIISLALPSFFAFRVLSGNFAIVNSAQIRLSQARRGRKVHSTVLRRLPTAIKQDGLGIWEERKGVELFDRQQRDPLCSKLSRRKRRGFRWRSRVPAGCRAVSATHDRAQATGAHRPARDSVPRPSVLAGFLGQVRGILLFGNRRREAHISAE